MDILNAAVCQPGGSLKHTLPWCQGVVIDGCQGSTTREVPPYLEQLATRCKETEEKSWMGLHDR